MNNNKNIHSDSSNKVILTSSEKGILELKTQEFMPTILIGLGGTGKEVLLRIRRQFVEKYGSINEFPIISYIYIDTDNAPSEESGMARERDLLINEIDFQPSEKIFKPVNPTDYIHRINDVPHIKKWLNTIGEIGKLGTMNTGAGQIRPAARLAFFHNYNEIVTKLNNSKARITDSSSINLVKNKHKIKDINTEKINVYVITSISGGTGAGMFLDFGFLIRDLYKNQAISSLYIVLPKIFQSYGKERIFANGYASLKELEYYNFRNTMSVSWRKEEYKKFQPGVYDDIYLIDGENYKNLSLSEANSRDIYKMIADSIFQDFSNSDFANYKRGVRVNLLQYKQRFWPEDNTASENIFSRKYSTFGQASISIPVDRIILACSYKLCEDIINYYLTYAEGSQSSIDNYLFSEFLPRLGLLETGNKHQILDSLYKIDEKSSIQTRIKEFLNKIQSELTEGKRGEKWSTFILSEKQKFDSSFKDDTDVKRLGLYYSQIYSNRTSIINELIGDRDRNLTGRIERSINTLINDSSRGVFYSINLLRRLQFILNDGNFDYIPKFEKDIKDLQILITNLESKMKACFRDMIEDESRSRFNVLKNTAMKGTLEKLLKTMYDYYDTIIKLRARFYAKEICQRILNLIEKAEKTDNGKMQFTGLISDINKLTGNLGILKENFIKKYNYFAQKTENSFNLHIYEPEEIRNEYYIKYIGTGENSNNRIKEIADRLLKELGASSITDIVNILKDSDVKIIENSMINFAKNQFEKIREDYNITDILFEKDSIRSESKIRSMLSQAYPWLRIHEVPGRFGLEESAKKLYIGIKTNTPSFKKFQNLIHSIIGSSVEFKDSAENSSIIFYTEWAGFPLFYSYSISEEMKQYYKQLSKNPHIDLHNDKNSYIYDDIIPMTTEEQIKLEESHRAFLLGLILGIFEIVSDTDKDTGEIKLIYKYTKQEGITVRRTEQLGIESRLINRLFDEAGTDTLRKHILKDAEVIINKLKSINKLAELLVIYEYFYGNVYKPEEIEIPGEAIKRKETYQYRIARKLANETEEQIPLKERDNFVKEVSKLKNELNKFSYLCDDGIRRVLKIKEILKSDIESEKKDKIKLSDKEINIDKLREIKRAFDEGLISKEEYEKAKNRFINK